ncbi:hypothetical protein PG987_009799 [Apiospora arundinis]
MGWGILGGLGIIKRKLLKYEAFIDWAAINRIFPEKDFLEAEAAADREAAIRRKRKDKKALTGNANAAIAAIVAQFVRPNLGCATFWRTGFFTLRWTITPSA